MPDPPAVEVLLTHILVRHLVPYTPTIGTDFDSLRPSATAAVRPAAQLDLTIVDDHFLVQRSHDRGADGHVLDAEAVGVHHVVLANLSTVVQVLLLLHGRLARSSDRFDAVEPFATPGANIAEDNGPQWVAMDPWERFAVHLKCEQDFIVLAFAPRRTHDVVHDLAFLEVRVCAVQLHVNLSIRCVFGDFEATAMLDHASQRDACPPCLDT